MRSANLSLTGTWGKMQADRKRAKSICLKPPVRRNYGELGSNADGRFLVCRCPNQFDLGAMNASLFSEDA